MEFWNGTISLKASSSAANPAVRLMERYKGMMIRSLYGLVGAAILFMVLLNHGLWKKIYESTKVSAFKVIYYWHFPWFSGQPERATRVIDHVQGED